MDDFTAIICAIIIGFSIIVASENYKEAHTENCEKAEVANEN